MIKIISNGSKWHGQAPDDLAELFRTLLDYPLDRTFERYGDFVGVEPELMGGGRLDGKVRFFGNFATVSHVFNVEMDLREDAATIADLTAAIEANKRRADYLSQPSAEQQEAARQWRIDQASGWNGAGNAVLSPSRFPRPGDEVQTEIDYWRELGR